MGLVIVLRQSAALSAIIGLGIWLMLTLISPALLNLFVLANEPLPNRAEVIHAVRNLNDRHWESPRAMVFDQFYAQNPQYDQGDTTDFNQWYYASFTLLDKEANRLKEQFEVQVARRHQWLKKWEWLAPAAMVHEKLSALSQTDRESHLQFVTQVNAFHKGLKDLYYPRIFANEVFTTADLQKLKERL